VSRRTDRDFGCSAGPNPIHPDRLDTTERLAEICRLLALGLLRLRARERDPLDHGNAGKSTELSATVGESSLHFPPGRSGHANPTEKEIA